MGYIYYKQVLADLIIYYYVNQQTRCVEGMISEKVGTDSRDLKRNIDASAWNDIDNNPLAQTLISSSVVVPREEYETALFAINAMIDSDYSIISENKISAKYDKEEIEVVAETVIC